jgi:hypothetical protein
VWRCILTGRRHWKKWGWRGEKFAYTLNAKDALGGYAFQTRIFVGLSTLVLWAPTWFGIFDQLWLAEQRPTAYLQSKQSRLQRQHWPFANAVK